MSRERLDATALSAVLFLCFVYTFPRWADWNQNSRFDLVVAIVDHGTLSIDCCVANTGDYALFEGRTYSDKAPGLSFLAVPVYAAFGRLSAPLEPVLQRLAQGAAFQDTLRQGGSGLLLEKIRFFLGMTVATALVVALPSALAGALLYVFLARVTPRRDVRVAVVLAWSLGTIAFPYSAAFYAHQLVASLSFAAFCLAAGPGRRRGAAELAACGLLLGLAVISEYPAVLIALPVGALLARNVRPRGDLLWCVAGALPPLALCAAYNLAIFGTPLPVGYRYSALWQSQHSTGLVSLTYPRLDALWGLTFSRFRGLFLLSPVLLFSLWGFALLWREQRCRSEVVVSAIAVAAFFAFASSSSMWWGGFAIGPRYLVPMLPFLAWPAAAVVAGGGRSTRIAFAAALAASIALVWGLALAGQQFPADEVLSPWTEYAWPRLRQGDLARNAGMILGLRGWASLLPLALAVAAIVAAWRWLSRAR